MSWKQKVSVAAMVILGAALLAVPVLMVVRGMLELWAAEVALLCAFAVALRFYALEWRRLRDERDERQGN